MHYIFHDQTPMHANEICKYVILFVQYTFNTLNNNLKKEHPLVDYTPPHYISLLFTDLGILTPSAVSDELIKLYL